MQRVEDEENAALVEREVVASEATVKSEAPEKEAKKDVIAEKEKYSKK